MTIFYFLNFSSKKINSAKSNGGKTVRTQGQNYRIQ